MEFSVHVMQNSYYSSENWISHGGSRYFIDTFTNAGWDRAQQECEDMNATLASIVDCEEHDFLKQNLDEK